MPLRFFGRNKWQKELAAGVEALEKGDFPAAEAQLIGAMERAEQMGPDNLAVADTAFALARLYTAQKRLTEARVNDQRAFTHRLEEMGAQDPKTVLSYLALMEYPQPPEYQEEGLLRATLALAQERHGEKDWRCARILSLILGKLPPASLEINGLASQAEAICRHMFGEARAELVKAPDVGGALGDVLKELGHIPAAAVFYSFSARYQEEISGAKSEGAAVALFKLGASLEKSGQSDQALAPLRRSLEIQALKFPSDHEMTRATVNLMALSLSSLGHTEEAGEYFARALEWIDPAHHEARARCLLGLLQAACLDPKKSRDRLLLTDQIVNLAPSLTGPALEYLAQGFRQSATLLSRFWLDAEARGLLEKALEWSQRARGTHDPEVARVHFELARLAHHRGSSQKAEELASKAMMVDDSAPLQIEEGLFLAQRGRWEDATKATQIAIKLLRAEEANPHTGELYMRLAEAQLASVQLDAAGRALRKAYELLPERRRNLAELCMGQLGCMRGSLVEGAKMMSSVLSRLQQLGDFPYQVTLGERDLAAAYYLGGRIDLAETHIERAIESLPPDHPAQAELGSLSARIAADQGRAYEARNKLKLAMQLLDAVTQRGEARRVEALVWAAHLHCDLGLDAEVGRQLCLEGLETTGFPSARMTIFPFPDASLPFLAGLVALHERQDEAKQAKIRAQVLLSRAQAVFEPGDPRLRLCKLWAGPGLEPQESAFVLQALREELARQGDQPRIWEQRALRGCAVANLRLGRVDDALSLARRGLELGKDDRLTDLIRGLEDPSSSPAPDDEIATPEPEPVAAEAVAEPEPVELELVRERAVEVEPDRGPEVVTESETLEFETLPRPEEFVEPEVAEEPESAEPEVAKEPEPAKLEVVTESETLEFEALPIPEEFVEPEVAEEPEPAEPEVAEEPEPVEAEVAEEPEPVEAEVAEEPEPVEAEVAYESTEEVAAEEPEPVEVEVAEEPEPVEAEVAEEPEPAEPEVAEEAEPVEPEVTEEAEPVEAEVAEEAEPAPPAQPDPFQLESVVEALEEDPPEAEAVAAAVNDCVDRYGHASHETVKVLAHFASLYPPESDEAVGYDSQAMELFGEWIDENPKSDLPDLASELAGKSQQRGRLESALGWYARAMQWAHAKFGPGSSESAEVLLRLGEIYEQAEQLEDAEGVYREALVLLESWYGLRSSRLLPTLASLARVSLTRGEFEAATEFLERQSKLLEGPVQTVERAQVLCDLMTTAHRCGEFERSDQARQGLLKSLEGLPVEKRVPFAEQLIEHGRYLQEEFWDPRASEEILSTTSRLLESASPEPVRQLALIEAELAVDYHFKGLEAKAQDSVARARSLTHDLEPAEQLAVLVRLSEVAAQMGAAELARELADRCLELEVTGSGKRSAAASKALLRVANLDLDAYRLEAAETAVAMARSGLAAEDQPQASYLEAQALTLLGRFDEAERIFLELCEAGPLALQARRCLAELCLIQDQFERALEQLEFTVDDAVEHPQDALDLEVKGRILLERGLLLEAGPYVEKAMQIVDGLVQRDDPRRARFLSLMSRLQWMRGEYHEAAELAVEAQDLKAPPTISLHTGLVGLQLAEALVLSQLALGQVKAAERTAESAHLQASEYFGEDDINTHRVLDLLARVALAKGDTDQAESHWTEAIDMARPKLGDEHSFMARCLLGLARLSLERKEWGTARTYAGEARRLEEQARGESFQLIEASLVLARAEEHFDLGEAEYLTDAALDQCGDLLGADHPLNEAIAERLEHINNLLEHSISDEEAPMPRAELAAPEDEEEPQVAEEPAAEEEPEVAEEPVAEEEPQVAEEPAAEEEPEVAEEPAAEEEPEVAEEPVNEEEPQVAEEPAAEEEPEVAEEPVAEEEPEVAEEPVAEEEPEVAEEPVAEEEPKVAEEPAAEEEPEVAEEPAAEEEPEVAEEPAAEEEPEVAEEPVNEAEPKVAEEPAAEEEPEVAEEPAAEEEPEVAEEPAAEQEPEVAEEPAAEEQTVPRAELAVPHEAPSEQGPPVEKVTEEAKETSEEEDEDDDEGPRKPVRRLGSLLRKIQGNAKTKSKRRPVFGVGRRVLERRKGSGETSGEPEESSADETPVAEAAVESATAGVVEPVVEVEPTPESQAEVDQQVEVEQPEELQVDERAEEVEQEAEEDEEFADEDEEFADDDEEFAEEDEDDEESGEAEEVEELDDDEARVGEPLVSSEDEATLQASGRRPKPRRGAVHPEKYVDTQLELVPDPLPVDAIWADMGYRETPFRESEPPARLPLFLPDHALALCPQVPVFSQPLVVGSTPEELPEEEQTLIERVRVAMQVNDEVGYAVAALLAGMRPGPTAPWLGAALVGLAGELYENEYYQESERLARAGSGLVGDSDRLLVAAWQIRGRVRALWGRFERAEMLLRKAHKLAIESPVVSRSERAQIAVDLATCLRFSESYNESNHFMEEAFDILAEQVPKAQALVVQCCLALGRLAAGRFEEGLKTVERALAHLEGEPPSGYKSLSLMYLARVHMWKGDARTSLELMEQAWTERVPETYLETVVLAAYVDAHLLAGAARQAEEAARELLTALPPELETLGHLRLGLALLLQRRFIQAEFHLRLAEELGTDYLARSQTWLIWAVEGLAELALLRGNLENGLKLSQQAHQLFELYRGESEDAVGSSRQLYRLSRVHARLGENEQAESLLEEARAARSTVLPGSLATS